MEKGKEIRPRKRGAQLLGKIRTTISCGARIIQEGGKED